MIALIRAREQQEKLRRHTRELDESYAKNPAYNREATVLGKRQYELARTLQPLEQRVKKDQTKKLVSLASGEMMNAGVNLRRPMTGQETVSVQTEIIELLAKALDQSMNNQEQESSSSQQQQQQQQQQNAAMMQAIMQMMAGSGGGKPGPQGGGGSTGFGDPGNQDIRGPGKGNQPGTEAGGKSGGSDPSVWPSSYRGMMDSYFTEMEAAP
jgi:hypothetical protein